MREETTNKKEKIDISEFLSNNLKKIQDKRNLIYGNKKRERQYNFHIIMKK